MDYTNLNEFGTKRAFNSKSKKDNDRCFSYYGDDIYNLQLKMGNISNFDYPAMDYKSMVHDFFTDAPVLVGKYFWGANSKLETGNLYYTDGTTDLAFPSYKSLTEATEAYKKIIPTFQEGEDGIVRIPRYDKDGNKLQNDFYILQTEATPENFEAFFINRDISWMSDETKNNITPLMQGFLNGDLNFKTITIGDTNSTVLDYAGTKYDPIWVETGGKLRLPTYKEAMDSDLFRYTHNWSPLLLEVPDDIHAASIFYSHNNLLVGSIKVPFVMDLNDIDFNRTYGDFVAPPAGETPYLYFYPFSLTLPVYPERARSLSGKSTALAAIPVMDKK